MATEVVEDQEDKLEAEATIGLSVSFDAASVDEMVVVVLGVVLALDSSSSSSMSGSWESDGLGRDICLGGNGGGFRNPFEVDTVVVKDVLGLAVLLDSEEATQVGTSEGHLQHGTHIIRLDLLSLWPFMV